MISFGVSIRTEVLNSYFSSCWIGVQFIRYWARNLNLNSGFFFEFYPTFIGQSLSIGLKF